MLNRDELLKAKLKELEEYNLKKMEESKPSEYLLKNGVTDMNLFETKVEEVINEEVASGKKLKLIQRKLAKNKKYLEVIIDRAIIKYHA